MGELAVKPENKATNACQATEFQIQLARQKTDVGGYIYHSRDPENRAQWVFETCPTDAESHSTHHGTAFVKQLRALEEGRLHENEELCMSCHTVPKSDAAYIPKLSSADAVPTTYIPLCNTCHGFHLPLFDYSGLTMMDISMTPDGKKMGNPAEYSPFPPMGHNELGCPQCHESPQESLAGSVTYDKRDKTAPCNSCHQAPTPRPVAKKGSAAPAGTPAPGGK